MSACFTCNEPIFYHCDCKDKHPPDLHPGCGETARKSWEDNVADLNNRFRRLSEKELSGEERPASEGVTRGLRWGHIALLYGRGGGKSIAAELMLLIEIARTAYRYRLVPLSATGQTQELAKLDALLQQFKKLDGD